MGKAQRSKTSPPPSAWVSTSTALTGMGRQAYLYLLSPWAILCHQAQHSESRVFSSSYCKMVLIRTRLQQTNCQFHVLYTTATLRDSVPIVPGSMGVTVQMYGTRHFISPAETSSGTALGTRDDWNILHTIPARFSSYFGRGERTNARTGLRKRCRIWGQSTTAANLYIYLPWAEIISRPATRSQANQVKGAQLTKRPWRIRRIGRVKRCRWPKSIRQRNGLGASPSHFSLTLSILF